jgi:tetraacyldisaccharide 4'-kinase
MPLKTPAFWYRSQSSPAPFIEKAMVLFSPLYQIGHKINTRKTAYKSTIPVICVGNAVAGGSGKTPSALALHAILQNNNIKSNPAFLTRGYKGSIKEPTLVDINHHDFHETGDEALLLAQKGQTIISPYRAAGARLAEHHSADIIIMDDGLQNPTLHKDLSFMVIDGMAGFGNFKTLPAGPLRENLDDAFARTDAFIIIGHDKRNVGAILPQNKPLFFAGVEADTSNLPDRKNPILAFSGLGQPDKFYRLLIDLGYEVKSWHPFADHHEFTIDELNRMAAIAHTDHLTMVTTEKDHMRLKNSGFENLVKTLPITLKFEDEPLLAEFLKERLAQ